MARTLEELGEGTKERWRAQHLWEIGSDVGGRGAHRNWGGDAKGGIVAMDEGDRVVGVRILFRCAVRWHSDLIGAGKGRERHSFGLNYAFVFLLTSSRSDLNGSIQNPHAISPLACRILSHTNNNRILPEF